MTIYERVKKIKEGEAGTANDLFDDLHFLLQEYIRLVKAIDHSYAWQELDSASYNHQDLDGDWDSW